MVYVRWGLLYGIIASFFVGQTFFILLHTSSKYGFKKTFPFVFAANITDILVAALSYYAVDYIFDGVVGINITLRGHIAAIISIILGIFVIIHKISITQTVSNMHQSFGYIYSFIKGAIINLSGPLIWITWIAISSYFIIQRDGIGFSWFVMGSFISILLIDTLKSYYATQLQKYIQPILLQRIQRSLGIIIIILGLFIRQRTTRCADDIDLCIEKTQNHIQSLFGDYTKIPETDL